MESLLPQLLAFPPPPNSGLPPSAVEYDTQIRCIVKLLNRISAGSLLEGIDGLDLLEVS